MGDLFSLYCQDCGYGVELRLGVGMIFVGRENLPEMVSKPRREKVRELLKRPDSDLVKCSHDLFLCPGCNLQASRFDYRIEYGDGEVYQPYFLCSHCRSRLVDDEHVRIMDQCPKCGSKNVFTGSGCWD